MFIDVLRHGEPVGGARYRGSTDDPLNETGRQQMASVLTDELPWTHIISSPLQRCVEFAKKLSYQHQLPLHIEPRLAEIDFGDWEGQTSKHILQQDAARLLKYWQDPENNTPPNGEPLAAFESRVLAAWNSNITHDKEHLLIVTHGGVLRIILRHILSLPHSSLFKINIPYACLSRFEVLKDPAQTQLTFHNGQLP